MRKFIRRERVDFPSPCGKGQGRGRAAWHDLAQCEQSSQQMAPYPYPLCKGEGIRLALPSPLIFTLRALIWLYRHTLAAYLGNQCRFAPSCSAYADEAIKTHGAWHGTGLALRRVCRCHPVRFLGGGEGFDPVPPRVK